MSESASHPDPAAEPSRDEMMAALFANLVLQHTQMGLMTMGKAPRPDSGQTVRDLDHAQMVIDQLEMLEAKTKGNLSKEEDRLLKQSLMTLRLAFVEAVDAQPGEGKPETGSPGQASVSPPNQEPAPSASDSEEESKKKFTKKY